MINRIPLYNEVESGKNVSNDILLQYVIDRLDSLEKNINIKIQSKSDELSNNASRNKLQIAFYNKELFSSKDQNEIIKIFLKYSNKIQHRVSGGGNILLVTVVIEKMYKDELMDEISEWINSKDNISYSCESLNKT